MSNYEKDPQRVDAGSQTQKDPVNAHPNNSVVTDDPLKNPPNNLGLADPREQDRSNDLVGSQNTEPVSDGPTAADQKKAAELAKKLGI
ncbi:uncharacterized protein JCM6883_002555 [Sporobolomyces salmoneus]|uniref:uncharacterized protein n=1 Tax=Sporobolomyces salmoneus TaxID=183962 RepID=UPI00317DB706